MANEMSADLVVTLLQELAAANKSAAAAETGACLISTPGNPKPTCTELTPDQCAKVKGVYVGGKCK